MMIDPTRKPDHARRLELHRLQSEFLITEQDYRRKSRRLEAVIMELRRLRMEANRLKVATQEKADEESRLKKDVAFLDAEMKRLKKKTNMMS